MCSHDRYKNGNLIPNNHVKFFDYPTAKIESTDPEDEGLYQFIARNSYGDAVSSFYLHVNITTMLKNVPSETKCYPLNNNAVFVTFKKEADFNMIYYYMASDSSPRQFIVELNNGTTSQNFTINREGQTKDIMKPLKKFYLYMRNMQPAHNLAGPNNVPMLLSRLSKPVVCSTQGFEPNFKKNSNGISFTWNSESGEGSEAITRFYIELQVNSANDSVQFESGMIGTYEKMTNQWSGDDSNFTSIVVLSSSKHERPDGSKYTKIEVPGNVSGIFIVNAKSLSVRILGSVQPNGELFDQDLRYLSWYNISESDFSAIKSISISDVESRSVRVTWQGVESSECKRLCLEFEARIRKSPSDKRCEIM